MKEESMTPPSLMDNLSPLFKSWRFWRPFIAVIIGGFGGFLYYYFIGCKSGSCPITSNPYMSIVWGGLLGYLLAGSFTSGKKNQA